MRGIRRNCAIMAAAGSVITASTALASTNASWLAPVSSSWTDPTAWSTNPVFPNLDQPNPGDLYNVTIGATGTPYTVTLDTDITIARLTLNAPGATFQQVSGNLQVADGGLNVSAGTYQMDAGTLLSDDPMNIATNLVWNGGAIGGFGQVNLGSTSVTTTGSSSHVLSTTMNNAGLVNIGTAPIQLSNGTLNNLVGGVINLNGGSGFSANNLSLLNNAGLINVTSSNTLTTITGAVQNSGTINVTSGTLSFGTGTVTHLSGSTITGGGTFDFGNSTHILAGQLTLNVANAVMSSSGGTISGSGDLQINDLLTWNSGTMSGTGTTRVAHNAAIDFSKSFITRGLSRTLNNDGVLIMGSSGLTLTNGTLNNLSDGVINVGNGTPFTVNNGTTSLLNNAGIINVNAASGSATLTTLNDSGTINAIAGTTNFNGSINFQTGAMITGSGTVDFNAFSGNYNVNGTLTLAGSNIRITNGTLSGTGNIILTNTLHWNGGQILAAGTFGTQSEGGLFNVMSGAVLNIGSLSGGSPRVLGRTLNNSGVINMLPTFGTLTLQNGTLNNLAGGTLNIFTTFPFPENSGSTSLVRNLGVINVDGSGIGGTASISLGSSRPILNAGTINLIAGSLALGNGTQSAGAFIGGPGYIDLVGISSATQTLDGTTTLAGPNLNLSAGTVTGEGNLLIRGNFNWGGGTFTGAGSIDVSAGSTFNVTNQNFHGLSRVLNNSGVMNLSPGSITITNGAINNLAGATINISSGVQTGVFGINSGTNALITNAGQINVTAGTGTVSLFNTGSSVLVDSGTINATSGTLLLGGGTFYGGATIIGNGFVDLVGTTSFGTVTVNDTLALNGSNVNFSTGTMLGAGNVNVNNVFTWNSGSLLGSGAINVAPNATMNVLGSITHSLGRTINNAGTLNVAFTSSLQFFNGVIDNQPGGVVNAGSPSTTFSSNGSLSLFVNDGVMNVGTFLAFNNLPLIDSGTININNGTLQLGSTTLEAGAVITGNGTLILNSSQLGPTTINGSSTISVSSARLSNGTLTGPGDLNITKSFSFDGGTISGSGVVNILPGATFGAGSLGSFHSFARTFNNSGVMNLTSSGESFGGGTINNTAIGVVNLGNVSSSFGLSSAGGVNRFVNAGTTNVVGGSVSVDIPFSNTGTVNVGAANPANSAQLTVNGPVSQILGSSLLRGTWIVHNNSFLMLGAGSIANNAANVTLDGPTSLFPNFDTVANNSGTFQITGGRTFTTSASYTNSGKTVIGPGSTLHVVGTLNSTGTLDVQGSLIVDGVSPGSILSQIVVGRAGGTWTGPGITSTSAAGNPQTALGFGAASVVGAAAIGTQTVDGSSIVVSYTLLGDSNLDHAVNALDFNSLASHFGQSSAIWSDSDFNYDGIVDTSDFTALANNFGDTLSPPPTASLGALVPEPVSLAGALLAMTALAPRRRSHAAPKRKYAPKAAATM